MNQTPRETKTQQRRIEEEGEPLKEISPRFAEAPGMQRSQHRVKNSKKSERNSKKVLPKGGLSWISHGPFPLDSGKQKTHRSITQSYRLYAWRGQSSTTRVHEPGTISMLVVWE
jgi:hypothetical protein